MVAKDLEDGEVSDNEEEESEEIVDPFDKRSLGSSDKENLDYSSQGKGDDRRHKEEKREWELKERVVSKVERDWEGGRRKNREKENSNFVSSSHPRKNWHLHHEQQQGEKPRKETGRR